jgi:hypothetical protein
MKAPGHGSFLTHFGAFKGLKLRTAFMKLSAHIAFSVWHKVIKCYGLASTTIRHRERL